MALVAVFLVIVGLNYLKVDLNLKPNYQTSNMSPELDSDWDDDGLNNREESYWNTDPNNPDTDGDNYLDGEEVVSSHDPLIPAPNDLIDNSNLTKKMSQLALAGIYEGSLKQDSLKYETALDDIARAIAEDAINSFEVDLTKINLNVTSFDKNSQQRYVEELSETYAKLLTILVEQMVTLEANLTNIGLYGFSNKSVVNSFEKSSAEYKNIFDGLLKVPVSKGWESNHLGLIKLVGELAYANQAVVAGGSDPIKAAAGLNKIIQLWEVLPEVTETYSNKIENSGLNSKTTIFK